MTTIAFTDACVMLGIDPKTLRHWLKEAQISFIAHPTDARLKCVTMEHIHQLATLHHRPLPLPPSSPLTPPQAPLEAVPSREASSPGLSVSPAPASSSCLPQEVQAVASRLSSLEITVRTLQEQVAQLALMLLSERSQRVEQRLVALEALLQQPAPLTPLPASPSTELAAEPASSGRRLLPAEVRARSRVTPLIEYGADGLSVAVCPQEGVLSLVPDSAPWFDWLASLTCFRFIGPGGRFTAYRNTDNGQRTRSWFAHRYLHGRGYKRYLGITDHLTIPRLEQMAATLQSLVASE